MAEQRLILNEPMQCSPGDTFVFDPPACFFGIHVEIKSDSSPLNITVFKDEAVPGNEVVRNDLSKPYIDYKFGEGHYLITVNGSARKYRIFAQPNSWHSAVTGLR